MTRLPTRPTALRRLCAAVIAVALPVATGAAPAAAQPPTRPPCDSALLRVPQGTGVGYAPRGPDRCEGMFRAAVSAPRLTLVSLTRDFPSYDASQLPALELRWDAPSDSGVSLRARSVKRETYFAMDAAGPPGAKTYRWPTNILKSENIRKADLGVLATTRMRVGQSARSVYLPLRIGAPDAGARRSSGVPDTSGREGGGALESAGRADTTQPSYQVLVFPSLQLEEVFVSLSALDSLGNPVRAVLEGKPLLRGYYPPRTAVSITIANPGPPGLYQLDISARGTAGDRITLPPVLFYHSGR